MPYSNILEALAAGDWKAAERFKPRLGEPTEAAPGSEEKLAVFSERVRRGEALFHPDDFRRSVE